MLYLFPRYNHSGLIRWRKLVFYLLHFCLIAVAVEALLYEPEDPKERLLGTWGLDIGATFNVDPELSKLSAKNQNRVRALAGHFIENMRLTFAKDGTLLTRAGDHKVRSQYVVDRVDGGRLVLTVTDSRPQSVRPSEKVQIIFTQDQMQMARGTQTMVLGRK